jgi:hypothetical protein
MTFLVINWRVLRAGEGEMYDLAQRVASSADNEEIMAELTGWFRKRIFPSWD